MDMIYTQEPQIRLNQPIALSQSEAFDADQHASNLTDWQQEYDQISSGHFYGRITELPMGNLQVFHEFTSQTLHQTCNVWPDSLWIGIAASPEASSRINGYEVGAYDVMCRPGNTEFELVTPENHDIYGLVVSHHALQNMAAVQGIQINWSELMHNERLHIPEDTLRSIRFLLQRLLREPRAQNASKLQYNLVMMAILELLQNETPMQETQPSHHKRKAVVEEARLFLQLHKDEPITISDLCEQLNVSRRTLQYSFESIIGVSPVQYLRMARLNAVRRALTHASADMTVTDIATQWGFWHLSQFSKDYKQLFGEKPSETRLKLPHSFGGLRS